MGCKPQNCALWDNMYCIDIDTTNIQIYTHNNHCFVSPGLTQRDNIKKMKWNGWKHS